MYATLEVDSAEPVQFETSDGMVTVTAMGSDSGGIVLGLQLPPGIRPVRATLVKGREDQPKRVNDD